jgi:hypothetical protein
MKPEISPLTHVRPIYSLMIGTQTMIVLNTDQAVKDLLDKRGNIYSSRPEMYLGSLVGAGMRMVLMVSPHLCLPGRRPLSKHS